MGELQREAVPHLVVPEEQSSIEQDIREHAFARVGFELGFHDINAAVQHYMDACAFLDEHDYLDRGRKKDEREYSVQYRMNNKRGSYAGHFIKGEDPNEQDEDWKRYFHYRDGLPDRIKRHGIEINSHLDEFLQAAEAIHEEACRTLYESMSELDERYPGLVGMHFPEHGDRDFYTRFLVYHPQENGQLARAHFDIGSMSLAMAESHPGLRIGTSPNDLTPVEHREGEAKTFLGGSWWNIYPESDLPPGWHDVIQSDKDQISDDIVRWAVVTFANPEQDVQPSQEETHTPSR